MDGGTQLYYRHRPWEVGHLKLQSDILGDFEEDPLPLSPFWP